jgi:D-3-phosphoglycerate dehydrogenase
VTKILISTVPFAEKNGIPIQLLKEAGIEYLINPIGRKLREDELAEMIGDFDILIAGTEIISDKVLSKAKNLKLISRVGIGLDSVDLLAAENLGIAVSYTPDAPAPAVAELTMGMIFTLLRNIHLANADMHTGVWHRYFGRRISEVAVGIIGVGRIGSLVLQQLTALGVGRILANDLSPQNHFSGTYNLEWASKEKIFNEADVVTLHLPLNSQTKNMIIYEELMKMKANAIIINTSRGGIINEGDLYKALTEGHLSGAGIDVFEHEPYDGPLKEIERCLLTCHMGSMSIDCRARMELEATEEAIRFASGKSLQGLVPVSEYEIRKKDYKT